MVPILLFFQTVVPAPFFAFIIPLLISEVTFIILRVLYAMNDTFYYSDLNGKVFKYTF